MAFGTRPAEIDIVRQRRRATVATRRGHCLHQPRQARAGYVNRWAGSGLFRPVVAAAFEFPVGIHVARLSVLSVAIHEASTYSLETIRLVFGLVNNTMALQGASLGGSVTASANRHVKYHRSQRLSCRGDSAGRPRRRIWRPPCSNTYLPRLGRICTPIITQAYAFRLLVGHMGTWGAYQFWGPLPLRELAGETACPTWFIKPLIPQGGAGGSPAS